MLNLKNKDYPFEPSDAHNLNALTGGGKNHATYWFTPLPWRPRSDCAAVNPCVKFPPDISDTAASVKTVFSDYSETSSLTENISSGSSETLNLAKNILPERSDTLNRIENTLSECSDTLNRIENILSEHSETLNLITNILSERSDTVNLIKNIPSEPSDAASLIKNMLSASSGSIPREKNHLKHITSNHKQESFMKIEKIDTNHLRNDAHFQFHTEFRDLVVKHDPQTLKVKPQFDEYKPLYERIDEALKKIVKSEFTAKIHEADKARDEIYIGMTETNTAALKHFDPAIREAASRLKIVFDTYGNVAGKTLNEETSAIYNLLQELQGKYAASVDEVGLTLWVSELEKRNKAFEALVKERFDETAGRSDIVMKTARAELDVVYRKIIERINALIIVDGEADYETFVKTFNAVIAKYAVRKHRHHQHNSGAPQETETEESVNV